MNLLFEKDGCLQHLLAKAATGGRVLKEFQGSKCFWAFQVGFVNRLSNKHGVELGPER